MPPYGIHSHALYLEETYSKLSYLAEIIICSLENINYILIYGNFNNAKDQQFPVVSHLGIHHHIDRRLLSYACT